MCHLCVHELAPERFTFVSEISSYLLNYKACTHCKNHRTLRATNRHHAVQDNDNNNDSYSECIEYHHECSTCSHIIAVHSYRFDVCDGEQFYQMKCQLCGNGEYTANTRVCQPTMTMTMQQSYGLHRDTHHRHDDDGQQVLLEEEK